MPVGKRQQSNTMLYTVIIFVGLFLLSTVLAVVYYLQAEKHRTQAATLQSQMDELASGAELRKIGAIVGTKQPRKSRLGTMVDYLDETVSLIIGGLPEDTSAEVKVDTTNRKVKDTLELLAQQQLDANNIEIDDPNAIGLIRIIEKLKAKMDDAINTALALQEQFEQLKNQFDDAMIATREKEQTLLAEKEKYQQQVAEIKQDYNDLKILTQQTSEQQVKTLMEQLDEERDERKRLNQQLLKTEAELAIAEERMKYAQEKLQALVPPPDSEIAAYKPDGKIILIDETAKIVHLNIGSDDHVYRGLTFSVYDKNLPIPKDGKGKAEIEVFNVGKNISAARITSSNVKKPVILDDIIANLIWDSDKTNVFVVAGEFDLDNDGETDYEAADKIKELIRKWGGRTVDDISIDTDFLVLGTTPTVLKRPTFEQIEVDPMAMEKYNESLQQLDSYKEIETRAQALFIPVFNAERFLYFIGYKTQSTRPGAF